MFLYKTVPITSTITSNNNNNFYLSSEEYYNYNRILSLLFLHVHL